MEIITLPKEELNKVYAAAEHAMLKEAKKLDEKGLPATDLFKATRKLVDQYTK